MINFLKRLFGKKNKEEPELPNNHVFTDIDLSLDKSDNTDNCVTACLEEKSNDNSNKSDRYISDKKNSLPVQSINQEKYSGALFVAQNSNNKDQNNSFEKKEEQNQHKTEQFVRLTIAEIFKVDLENVEFTGEFAKAFELMETTSENLIITGKAGTGKSTLLKYFLVNTKKQAVALAPTGVAALNIQGDTIHAFFHFPPKILDKGSISIIYDDKYKSIDTLILDEFSMINANLFDAIDLFMRANGKDATKPFGGVQLILFGDFFQLPPVVTHQEVSMFFAKEYGNPWFFSAKVFKCPDFKYKVVELQQNHRQGNTLYANILDNLRFGKQTYEQLELINNRFGANIDNIEDYPIIIVPTNRQADQINMFKLNSLPGESISYDAVVGGDFSPKRFPTHVKLQLKPGAQVMTLYNDPQHRFVNGTLARVISLTEDAIEIEVKQRGNFYKYTLGKHRWFNCAYRYSYEDHRVVRETIGEFVQFPVKPAWAITVHKSQGLTFDAVTLDIGESTFESGQAYVALSRCRTLEGMRLNSIINKGDIKVDPYAKAFYEKHVTKI